MTGRPNIEPAAVATHGRADSGRRHLRTRSVCLDAADALERLGTAEGTAEHYLAGGQWVDVDGDRVRLVPIPADAPHAGRAFALAETEHARILVP